MTLLTRVSDVLTGLIEEKVTHEDDVHLVEKYNMGLTNIVVRKCKSECAGSKLRSSIFHGRSTAVTLRLL